MSNLGADTVYVVPTEKKRTLGTASRIVGPVRVHKSYRGLYNYKIRYTHTHTHCTHTHTNRHKHIPTDEHHNTIAYSYNAAMHLPYPEPTLPAEAGPLPWRLLALQPLVGCG